MHYLGQGGFHWRATSGRENDGGERGLAHQQLPADQKTSAVAPSRVACALNQVSAGLQPRRLVGGRVPDLHAGLITVNSAAANLRRRQRCCQLLSYSTVTNFATLRGWSASLPMMTAV